MPKFDINPKPNSNARAGEMYMKAKRQHENFERQAKKNEYAQYFPPKERLKKLYEMLAQLTEAYENTGSWTARKKIEVVRAHIDVANREMSLPTLFVKGR